MEIKWRFSLSPIYNPDLSTLAADLGHCNANFNILCLEDDNGPYYEFNSDLLDELSEPNEVHKSAIQLKQLLDGILFLTFEERTCLPTLGDLYNDDKRIIYEKALPAYHFEFEKYLNSEYKATAKPVAHLLELAKTEKHLRELLYILGAPISFRQLFIAFETTQTLLNGDVAFKNLMGTELNRRISLFTNVANNYQAIGIEARHRDLTRALPKEEMSLDEAKNIIVAMVLVVIKHRYTIELPYYKKIEINVSDLF